MTNAIGCNIVNKHNININGWLFGEDQGRYVLIVDKANSNNIIDKAIKNNIYAENIGQLQNEYFEVNDGNNEIKKISIEKLSNIRNNWFENYFST